MMPQDISGPMEIPIKHPFVACGLAWLIPGGGHFYLRKRLKGALFCAIVLCTLFFGLALGGKLYIPERDLLSVFATLASLGDGPLYFLLRFLGYGQGTLEAMTYEYGNTFTITAGLMNILLILDVFDIATGRKT